MHIVLDTNFLYGTVKDGIIKLETNKLRLLLGFKEQLKFNLSIPLPVLMELKRKAKERYNIFDDNSELIISYNDQLDLFIKTNSINVIPFPSKMPRMEDLFCTAVNKEFPFDRKGQSFRDAVIWYSVKEFANSNKKSEILLISDDKHVAGITKNENLQTLRFDELKNKMEKLLPHAVREERMRIREQIKTYLFKDKISEIKEYISNEHEFRLDIDAGESLIDISDFVFSGSAKIDLVEIKDKIIFAASMHGELIYNVSTSFKNKRKVFKISDNFLETDVSDITKENRQRQYLIFIDAIAEYSENFCITNIEINNIGKTELPKAVV